MKNLFKKLVEKLYNKFVYAPVEKVSDIEVFYSKALAIYNSYSGATNDEYLTVEIEVCSHDRSENGNVYTEYMIYTATATHHIKARSMESCLKIFKNTIENVDLK